jgi:hypothetical protein
LGALLATRQRQAGYPSLDATAEAFIAHGLVADDAGADHSAGYDDDQLRGLIDEADASGPAAPWDPVAIKAEVLRRYALGRGERK